MKDKKLFILGFAKSGYEAAKLLIKNNKVLINDLKEKDEDIDKINELKSLGVEFFFGSHPDELLDSSFDYLIKNPGIAIDHKYVLKAKKLNISVINEVELAYMYLKDKVEFISITGTNGKTTTTTLIYEMLKEDKKPVHLAGNIGFPLSSFVNKVNKGDIIVLETSCQQLENMDTFNPNVAVMTNISEAHLEFMKTFEHYLYVKSKLLKNQDNNNIAVLNKNDKYLVDFSKNIKSNTKWFSSTEETSDSYLKDNYIYYKNEQVININDIKLRGIHNYENIMAAIIAVKEYNCSFESIIKVLITFTGVEHRLEFVDNVNNRLFYNDTEATNVKCTQIALSAFTEPTIVILGGYERGQNFNDLQGYLTNVKAIIGIGECRNRVLEFGNKNNIETYIFETLNEGFKKCINISNEGDVILLSPASASWDQYNKCEERGDEFKKYVSNMK